VDRLELKAFNFGKDDGAQSVLPGGETVPAPKSGTFHIARRLVSLGGSSGGQAFDWENGTDYAVLVDDGVQLPPDATGEALVEGSGTIRWPGKPVDVA
jgi:hypothetical protein